MFTSYEIYRCAQFNEGDSEEAYTRVLQPDESIEDLEDEGLSSTFWTLYGRYPDDGTGTVVQAVSDMMSRADCLMMYQRITGRVTDPVVTGENEPITALPPAVPVEVLDVLSDVLECAEFNQDGLEEDTLRPIEDAAHYLNAANNTVD